MASLLSLQMIILHVQWFTKVVSRSMDQSLVLGTILLLVNRETKYVSLQIVSLRVRSVKVVLDQIYQTYIGPVVIALNNG